jgi:tetratricopeptide (TPR) repeat protein
MPGSYEVEGLVLLGEGKRDDARAAFAQAIERRSANFFPYYWWAANPAQRPADLASRQRLQDALQQAVTLNGSYAPAYAALARVTLDLKRNDEALDRAKRAVVLEPGMAYARLVLAQAMWATHDRAAAVREAREALAVARDDADRRSAQEAIAFYSNGAPQ